MEMKNQSNANTKPLIVVTGSSGLIGKRLIKTLTSDYRVVGLDIAAPDTNDCSHIECDLTDDESVQQAVRKIEQDHGERIASVVHLAAYYDFSGEPSPLYDELTVEGTKRLLRSVKDSTADAPGAGSLKVEQFIFSSSLLVMKPSEDGHPITASSPVEAEWDYPQSKLRAEEVITNEGRGMNTVILRIAGVYDEQCHSIPLAQQMARIHEKQMESYLFPGDKTNGQSFIHLDDVVDCIQATIGRRSELAKQEVFVIGEEDVMTYEELQESLGELLHGKEWPTIRIPATVAKVGAWAKDKMATSEEDSPFIKPWMIDLADQNYPVNIHRARELLGWAPQHTLRQTLPAMVRCLQEDPRRWYEINGLPLPDRLSAEETSNS